MKRPSGRAASLERLGLTSDRRRIVYAYLAAILLFVIGEIVHPGFASPGSITAILTVASFVGLVAAGQTFVVLIGGIDLSVPWVLNGAAILLVTSSLGQDSRSLYAPFLTLGVGAAAGLVNGFVIAFLGVPAVVMTLAMDGMSGGMTCEACASYAPPVVQDAVHGSAFGVPAAVILWIGVIALVSFILSLTTFGRKTYAIGNNPLASYLAGVNVRLVTMLLYVLSGFSRRSQAFSWSASAVRRRSEWGPRISSSRSPPSSSAASICWAAAATISARRRGRSHWSRWSASCWR
ncbi:MAG TPA: ABC transporter permease [Roseiarcus sp.]|nr:ABC transporter permease [Roseiarcus sp.]